MQLSNQAAFTFTVSTTFLIYPAGFQRGCKGCDWLMRFVAFTFNSNTPACSGLKSIVHSRKEYFPKSFPSRASRHVFPPSAEKLTSVIPYPPSKAIPRTVVPCPTLILSPSPRFVINERTL